MSVDEDMWGGRLDWYRDWISHPKDADAYWDEGFWGLLKSIPSKVKVPMFIHEGWFDHHLGSALTGYAALNEQVKEHSWLRIGCWNHYFLNPQRFLACRRLLAAAVRRRRRSQALSQVRRTDGRSSASRERRRIRL